MKNALTTYEEFVQSSLPAQQSLSGTPFPKKCVYSVIDDLRQAEQAIEILLEAGYSSQGIHFYTSEQFVAAVANRLRQRSSFGEALFRFFASTDDGFFGDVYLHEASQGHHILVMHLSRSEQMEQVHDLLVLSQAHHIKYVGTWTVADLHAFMPYGMRQDVRSTLGGAFADAATLLGRNHVPARLADAR